MHRIPCALVLALAACAPERGLAPIAPCTEAESVFGVGLVQTADVADVLVVVDGSDDRALAAAMPAFIEGLRSGDFDHDGLVEATPMRSVRIGITTSVGCAGDTHLVRGPRADADGLFVVADGALSATEAAAAISDTLALVTDDGCALSRPLAAAAEGAALFPTTDDGLVRPVGVLVVIVASAADDDGSAMSPARFASDLEALRPDAEMVVLALLTDVPDGATADLAPPGLLDAASDVASYGSSVVYGSTRAEDDTRTLDAVGVAITRCVIGPDECLALPFVPEANGFVPCDLEAVLPALGTDARYTHCAQVASAYELASIESVEGPSAVIQREVCRIHQIPSYEVTTTSEPGWFYDDRTFGTESRVPAQCPSTITLRGASFVAGSEIRLRCRSHLTRPLPGLGAPCDPMDDTCSASLVCDPALATCGMACRTDADCHAAGLASFACDTRGFCASPTCS